MSRLHAKIDISGLSQSNNTSTPLNAGNTWTGAAEILSANENYTACLVDVETDQDGTYIIEVSQDGTNFKTIGSYNYRAGGVNRPHIFQIGVRSIRVSFTNTSASNQTYLRLQTYLGQFNPLTVPLNGSIVRDADSTIVRTIDESIEVARGKFDGRIEVIKFGLNDSIDTTSDPEDIWNGGGDYTGFNPTSGEAVEVLSSSASDAGTVLSSGTATGGSISTLIDSGATFSSDGVAVGDLVINDTNVLHGFVESVDSETQLTVYQMSNGVDRVDTDNSSGDSYRVVTAASTGTIAVRLRDLKNTSYVESAEYVVLNGTTPVDSSGTSYIRLTSFQCIGAGSNLGAVGTITARQTTTTANVFGVIPIGAERTIVGAYTVPAGYTAYMNSARFALTRTNGSAGSAVGGLFQREIGGTFVARRYFNVSTAFPFEPDLQKGPINFSERSDIKWRAISVSDNNSSVSAGFSFQLIQE